MSQMTARQISPKVTVSVVFVAAMLMTIMDRAIVNLAGPLVIWRPMCLPQVQGANLTNHQNM